MHHPILTICAWIDKLSSAHWMYETVDFMAIVWLSALPNPFLGLPRTTYRSDLSVALVDTVFAHIYIFITHTWANVLSLGGLIYENTNCWATFIVASTDPSPSIPCTSYCSDLSVTLVDTLFLHTKAFITHTQVNIFSLASFIYKSVHLYTNITLFLTVKQPLAHQISTELHKADIFGNPDSQSTSFIFEPQEWVLWRFITKRSLILRKIYHSYSVTGN